MEDELENSPKSSWIALLSETKADVVQLLRVDNGTLKVLWSRPRRYFPLVTLREINMDQKEELNLFAKKIEGTPYHVAVAKLGSDMVVIATSLEHVYESVRRLVVAGLVFIPLFVVGFFFA